MSDIDPALLPAEDLLAGYARGSFTPLDALNAIGSRISRLNPGINAFVVMNPGAEAEAAASTARWAAGRPNGPLDGVPVTIKDLIDVQGFPTRRGSKLTDPAPATADAPLTMGLRSAGAIVIGKTTTTEFGWKTPGDNPLNGITRNPWNTAYTPGGSSSGAGAAAAAGFGPLHVGTDAGGSIRIPAAWCGVVGLKPTFGRVPQWPLGAFAPVAVAGPMTRTVRDCALMLSAMARFDLRDPYALPDDNRDWRDTIEDGVAELRVAILRNPGFPTPTDPDSAAAVDDAARYLAEAGAEVEEADPGLPDMRALFSRIWGVALTRLVNTYPDHLRSQLDPGLLDVAAHNISATALDMIDYESARLVASNAMAGFHRRYDLLLCPSVPNPPMLADDPTINPVEALWTKWAPWTCAFNLTRQPAISIPMGFAPSGLPRSVQIAAPMYRDDLVLRAARTLEHACPFAMPDI